MSGKKKGEALRVELPGTTWPRRNRPAAASASVIARNSAGEVLLAAPRRHRPLDHPRWRAEEDEILTACAVRECREETGLEVDITGLAGVFSDPGHATAYASGEFASLLMLASPPRSLQWS